MSDLYKNIVKTLIVVVYYFVHSKCIDFVFEQNKLS